MAGMLDNLLSEHLENEGIPKDLTQDFISDFDPQNGQMSLKSQLENAPEFKAAFDKIHSDKSKISKFLDSEPLLNHSNDVNAFVSEQGFKDLNDQKSPLYGLTHGENNPVEQSLKPGGSLNKTLTDGNAPHHQELMKTLTQRLGAQNAKAIADTLKVQNQEPQSQQHQELNTEINVLNNTIAKTSVDPNLSKNPQQALKLAGKAAINQELSNPHSSLKPLLIDSIVNNPTLLSDQLNTGHNQQLVQELLKTQDALPEPEHQDVATFEKDTLKEVGTSSPRPKEPSNGHHRTD